jgi:hypothetical protein
VHPEELRRAFDAFEERTHGVDTWPNRVNIEPLFRPILAPKRTQRQHLDDSRKPGIWDRLRGNVATPTGAAPDPEPPSPQVRADDARDIAELTLLVPENLAVKGDVAMRLLLALRGVWGELPSRSSARTTVSGSSLPAPKR